MQYFDINLAPGVVREINVQGSFVYFLNGSAGGADTTIELRAVSGADTVLLRPGQAFRLGASNNQRWIVANHAGQGTIIGQLLMGDGDFSDNRISGSVEVIDGGKNRTMSGTCFGAYQSCGNVAGQYAHVELFNPAASGKNVFVEGLQVGASIATTGVVRTHTAALANPGTVVLNKKAGGAIGSALLYRENNAATLGSAGSFSVFVLAAGTSRDLKYPEPVLLPPGYGLLIVATTLATDLTAAYDYYEEPI